MRLASSDSACSIVPGQEVVRCVYRWRFPPPPCMKSICMQTVATRWCHSRWFQTWFLWRRDFWWFLCTQKNMVLMICRSDANTILCSSLKGTHGTAKALLSLLSPILVLQPTKVTLPNRNQAIFPRADTSWSKAQKVDPSLPLACSLHKHFALPWAAA